MDRKAMTPLLLIIAGILLVWLGVTGRLGDFLAAVFTPNALVVNE